LTKPFIVTIILGLIGRLFLWTVSSRLDKSGFIIDVLDG